MELKLLILSTLLEQKLISNDEYEQLLNTIYE